MVARRIERIATDIRGYSRKIEGSSHNFGGGYIETTAPATGAYRERLITQRAQLEDEHATTGPPSARRRPPPGKSRSTAATRSPRAT